MVYIFIFFCSVGICIYYCLGSDSSFWTLLSVLDTSSAVALAILATYAYYQMTKEDDEIELLFNVNGNLKSSGLKLLRKNCTRGEIVGVLGMMQKDNAKRFTITPYELKRLLDEIKKVQKENKDTIIINMTQYEFEQFLLD